MIFYHFGRHFGWGLRDCIIGVQSFVFRLLFLSIGFAVSGFGLLCGRSGDVGVFLGGRRYC